MVDDRIEATDGVLWHVTGSRPAADRETDDRVTWNDIGNIATGEKKSVEIDVVIQESSSAGRFTDRAKATASCGTGGADAGNGVDINLTGRDRLDEPRVVSGPLPDTGSSPWVPIGAVVLVSVGVAVRRLVRA
jgi:hypothetical protein